VAPVRLSHPERDREEPGPYRRPPLELSEPSRDHQEDVVDGVVHQSVRHAQADQAAPNEGVVLAVDLFQAARGPAIGRRAIEIERGASGALGGSVGRQMRPFFALAEGGAGATPASDAARTDVAPSMRIARR